MVETCEHSPEESYRASPVVSVPFKPGHYAAINGHASTKAELYEKAARKGILIAKDQLP